MASFSVPCPKTSALFGALQPKPKKNQQPRPTSILFQSDCKSNRPLLAGSSQVHSTFLGFEASGQNQNDVFRACAQLSEVVIETSNNAPVLETKPEESTEKSDCQTTIPDVSAISAFMAQVADLVELVDSRDIMELQLKQLDCEVLIRKKEALPVAAPFVTMQSPYPQAMFPSQLPPAQVATPASAAPAPSPPVSAPASPTLAKPKSSHPSLKCPMAGTFYRCPSPGSPPFVKVGDKVQKGQVVCIIEAMKLMNDIEADQSGTIVEILVDDGKPVSLDMPLFVIEP